MTGPHLPTQGYAESPLPGVNPRNHVNCKTEYNDDKRKILQDSSQNDVKVINKKKKTVNKDDPPKINSLALIEVKYL